MNKTYGLVLSMILLCIFASDACAQLSPVYTPGLTPPQCVKSSATTTIVDAGPCVTTPGLTPPQCVQSSAMTAIVDAGACPGRLNVLPSSSSYSLTNADCGSVVPGPGGGAMGNAIVTLPSSPPANCEFAFEPSTYGFYIDFNGKTALLPADGRTVTQWTIPVVTAFRTSNPSVSLQYNGTFWEQSNVSSSIFETTVRAGNAAQIAQGQVYFKWDSSAAQFKLCWSGGPGGLIVDGVMEPIPGDCLALAQSATTSAMLNYFYAVHTDDDEITVSGVAASPVNKIRLTVSNSRGNIGDTVLVECVNIAGAIQANVTDAATVVNGTTLDLKNTSSDGIGTYTMGGDCKVTRLEATTNGHFTEANGIEEMIGGTGHYTLVGACQIGPEHSVSDRSNERDCMSWYNRGTKTCINELSADRTTASTSFTEVGSEIRCGFVTWGTGDPMAQSDLSWSISGMMKNSTAGDGVAVTAGFDGATPESEQTGLINAGGAISPPINTFPLSVKGSKSGLTEGWHYITLLAKTLTGGTATISGNGPPSPNPVSSVEVRIPQ